MEKLGSKAGVNAMSIKGVLQEMVDDDQIRLDKIGISNYYWCFPSEALSKKQAEEAKLESSLSATESEIESLTNAIEKAKSERKESKERTTKLKEIEDLKTEIEKLNTELQKYSELEAQRGLVQKLELCKQAAHRWTDNTWTLADYLKKKYGCNSKDVQRQLQMADDFDYPVYTSPKKRIKA